MASLNDIVDALILGGTGISIVFIALIAVMLIMMALTRLFRDQEQKAAPPILESKAEDPLYAERKLAAAIAVSLALALQSKVNVQGIKPTRPASRPAAWKLQGRANLMVSRLTERDGSWR